VGISGQLAASLLSSKITALISVAVLAAGVFALIVTPREEDPEVDVTLVEVSVPFPGASAKDVDALVVGPAERLLSRVEGVDHIVSVARPGTALITVQFRVGESPTQAMVRLYDTIKTNRDWVDPALGVGEPLIKRRAIDDIAVFTVTLWTRDPTRSAYDLAQIAHSLEPEIKRIEGTRDVTTLGGPPRMLRVLLDPQRLNAHGVTVSDVCRRLRAAGHGRDAGVLVGENHELFVDVGASFESAPDVAGLVVSVHDGQPVFLGDVARVVDGPAQPANYVWFGRGAAGAASPAGRNEVHPAVTLAVSKMRGVDATKLTPRIARRLGELRGVIIPDGVEFTVTRDYGASASEKAHLLIFKLIFITSLVSGMVLVVLGWRESVVIGLAVSLTLLVTLFASWAAGFTLNRVSLFALIFSVGFLVDDAIVVVENVHRWRMLHPKDRLIDIIPAAVDEVGGPTILATFTVIVALMPLAMVPGLMGSFMRPVPINASMGMFLSLLIAFTVTPWLMLQVFPASQVYGTHPPPPSGLGQRAAIGAMRRAIGLLIDERQGRTRRRVLYVGVVIAIAGALSLPAFNQVLLKLLSVDNQSEFMVVLDMPVGTPVEMTSNVLLEMAEYLHRIPEMRDFEIYAGTPGPFSMLGLVRQYDLRNSPELGLMQVNLLDRGQRKRQSHAIALAVRGQIEAIARSHGGDARLAEPPPGPPVISPIVAEIYGPDYEGQRQVARFVRAVFDGTPDVISVFDSLGVAAAQSTLRVRVDRAAMLGVPETDIEDSLETALSGATVGRLSGTPGESGVPIRISLPSDSAGSLPKLLGLKLRADGGALVPLAELVDVVPGIRDAPIHHKDLRPVVYVFGDLGGGRDSSLYGMFDIRARLQRLAPHQPSLPDGRLHDFLFTVPSDVDRGYSIKWDGDWDITYKTFRNIIGAFLVGLGFIYLLLVGYFRSYVTPLLIMAPIPLTVIGVLPGHWLLGARFTATSVIGMAALAGITVRNSILLVQFIDEQVAAGMAIRDAVIESTIARARPIGLAALAAMLGAILLIDDPIFGGLAISLLFGVLAATLLTLLVLPPLYHERLKRRRVDRK